jgi:ATP-dependent Clp protease adapter protein ClpS
MELTRFDSGRAMKIMMTAHTTGAALVLVTHKERAELFRDQFASKRLKATIEPAD